MLSLPDMKKHPVADENIQARIRGMYLMYMSNRYGYLLLGTGNKTELSVGYCTLYGDMASGFTPISDLLKMEVYTLAKYINEKNGNLIPKTIIDKEPSAELSLDQKDTDSLPPYPILDEVVKNYIENNKIDRDHLDIIRKIDGSEFKRYQSAPGIKLSKVAFGEGRRLPIVKKLWE